MFNPILEVLRNRKNTSDVMNIVLIGAGGNAGPLVQKIARTMYAFQQTIEKESFWNNTYHRTSLLVCDGDVIEEKNLLRQPFIKDDVAQYKAEVLANRYAEAYGVPIYSHNSYIDKTEEIHDLFQGLHYTNNHHRNIDILIGCVDNHATRQIMHAYFMSQDNLIYIDAGIEGIQGDSKEDKFEAGYSGQVVCGLRVKGQTILEPVGVVYPNILEDKDSLTPTQACGMTIVNHPQRMQTNETAALVVHSFINNLIFDGVIVSHAINFNAQTMTSRPTYIKQEIVDVFDEIMYPFIKKEK